MKLFKLAWASLLSRKANALLTVVAIAISVMLLLGVDRVSQQTRAGFANTISGTDLIVGARSGPVNLLLFSVFHIGYPSSNVSWDAYAHWREHEQVAWSIPIALGDSFRGHPVIATDHNFFDHFQYGQRQSVQFAEGHPFEHSAEAVLGARVAKEQGLRPSDEVVISHGTGSVSFHQHDEDPVQISGVLAPTGTPLDNAVFIPLVGLATMHGEHQAEEPQSPPSFSQQSVPQEDEEHEHEHEHEHEVALDSEQPIDSLSAFFVGLHSQPRAIFMQRMINTWGQEPLTALMPGATLQELWRTLNMFERVLAIVSGFVLLTGLIGMLATLLASLQERRREMAVLRSLGAGPGTIFSLLVSEAFVLTVTGIGVGVALLYAALYALAPWIEYSFGVVIHISWPSVVEWQRMAIVLVAGTVISCLPAWRAYRNSLADGLTIKL
ncbi:ABC transporter permease [Aliidiomarina sedimenti]|uniref:ABC transporter permease n=1 Tax=Aliidiomarina sedimenti TaxID=1933879 RepID=A0ABY0BVA2_9GAMM|nr:ABC transporter permease [Aliidiomarina sedimenti]RUO27941.1 ABC transporter permease [Aliidiomarina sedimenti]